MADSDSIIDVSIGDSGIRLGQFLQLAGLVDSGGEAKEAIRALTVRVNGTVDDRRGRQLQIGDVVTVGDRGARVSV